MYTNSKLSEFSWSLLTSMVSAPGDEVAFIIDTCIGKNRKEVTRVINVFLWRGGTLVVVVTSLATCVYCMPCAVEHDGRDTGVVQRARSAEGCMGQWCIGVAAVNGVKFWLGGGRCGARTLRALREAPLGLRHNASAGR